MREARGLLATAAAVAVAALVAAGLAAPAPASAEVETASVVIDEIHYHPATDLQEFIELANPGSDAVDLSGACFTAGITGCFPTPTTIAPGGFVVAAQSAVAYAAAFAGAPPPALIYGGSLSNGGETVTLSSATPAVLDTVAYSDSAPWPMTPDGDGPSLELTDLAADNSAGAVWRASDPAPTPGAPNSQLGAGPGPSIASSAHGPAVADQPITVTASVQLAATVAVEVTVGFDPPTTVPMVDDGAHQDGSASDGTYGAQVPGQPAGTLVRYRVVATSASGTAMLPPAGSTRPRDGLVVARAPTTTALPVLDWFVSPSDFASLMASPWSNDYVPSVVAVGDEVWDGAEVRVHGNGRSPAKYSYKIKMPKGSPLVAPFLADPVDELVLDGDREDPTGVLAPLTSSIYADDTSLLPQMVKVHVEQNGSPFGLFTLVEELEDGWLARNHLTDPGDQVFEPEDLIGVLQDDGSAAALGARFEQEQPKDDDFTDLYELVQAIDSAPTEARSARLRDLLDVPALIDALAIGAIVQHWDTTVHNYDLLRDGSSGRWQILPNDFDLTLGNGTGVVPALFPYGPDGLTSAVRSDPVLSELYLRRVRTLADRYLAGGVIGDRLAALAPTVSGDVAADLARWPRTLPSQASGVAAIRAYLAARTKDLLVTHRVDGEIPPAASPTAPVSIAAASYAGTATDQVRLRNPSATEALDISGWVLAGAGDAVLPPGSVIPSNGDLYVPADAAASAGDRPAGSIVAGSVPGGLDDAGGELRLVDTAGTVRAAAVLADLVPSTPALASGLRVEAAADQVETLASDGAGVRLTVAVANRGPATATVQLAGPRTTCGRSLGALAAGASVVVRCRTTAGPGPDRTYRLTASAPGSAPATSAPVEVRAIEHRTSYYSQYLLPAPTVGTVTLGPGGALRATVVAPDPAVAPLPNTPPLRAFVATGIEPGRAVPTQGAMVAPTPVVSIGGFALGRPVRVALAARSAPGTGARSPLTPFLTPRATVTWPFASTSALVDRVFADLDGRAPTAAERSAAVAAIDGGSSPAELIAARLRVGRWPSEVEPLIRLYAAYLGRPPDSSGLRYWLARRAEGRTLNVISSSFAASPEFRRATGKLDDAAFVRFVYTSVLGRSPDAAGLAYWTSRVRSGWTRGRVMTSFSESSEGRRTLGPEVGPTLVSLALLGRPPTASAATPATDWLRAGGSLVTVIDGIRTSAAYEDRVG